MIHASSVHPEVDWRQLRRWNIPESALPPGTEILYRQPTARCETYRKYVVAAVVLMVVQTLLIIGLLWQRAPETKSRSQAE